MLGELFAPVSFRKRSRKKIMFLTKDKFSTNCRALKKELLEFSYYSSDICPEDDKVTYRTLLDNMLEFLNRF